MTNSKKGDGKAEGALGSIRALYDDDDVVVAVDIDDLKELRSLLADAASVIEQHDEEISRLTTELETFGSMTKCDKCGRTERLCRDITFPHGGTGCYYCLECWDERKDAEIARLTRENEELKRLQKRRFVPSEKRADEIFPGTDINKRTDL